MKSLNFSRLICALNLCFAQRLLRKAKLLEVAGTAKSYSKRQKLLKSCRAQTWQAYLPGNTNSLRSPLRNGLRTVYILLQVVNARSWVARNTSRIKLNLFSLKMLVLQKVILKVVFQQKKKIDLLLWSIIYCSYNRGRISSAQQSLKRGGGNVEKWPHD